MTDDIDAAQKRRIPDSVVHVLGLRALPLVEREDQGEDVSAEALALLEEMTADPGGDRPSAPSASVWAALSELKETMRDWEQVKDRLTQRVMLVKAAMDGATPEEIQHLLFILTGKK